MLAAWNLAESGNLAELQPTTADGQAVLRDLVRAVEGGFHRGDGIERFAAANDFLGTEPIVRDPRLVELLAEVAPLLEPSEFD